MSDGGERLKTSAGSAGKRQQTLRESCRRGLAAVNGPVHYSMLLWMVWAETGLRPRRGEVVAALRALTLAGLVRRVRLGVYQTTRKGQRGRLRLKWQRDLRQPGSLPCRLQGSEAALRLAGSRSRPEELDR